MDLLNCQMRNMALRQPLHGLKVSKDTYNKLFFINTHSIDATVQVGMILPLFSEKFCVHSGSYYTADYSYWPHSEGLRSLCLFLELGISRFMAWLDYIPDY